MRSSSGWVSAALLCIAVSGSGDVRAGGSERGGSESPSAGPVGKRLTLTPLAKEPKEGRERPSAERLAELRKGVIEHPEERSRRFELVRGIMASGDMPGAL